MLPEAVQWPIERVSLVVGLGGELTVDDVQVGAAHPEGEHTQLHLPRAGGRFGDFGRPQRPSGAVEHHPPHAAKGSVSR